MVGFLVAALATAGLDLRRWFRQPLAVVMAIALPAVVAVLVSTALGGEARLSTRWAVVDHDRGPAAAAFRTEALGSPAIAGLVTVENRDLASARRRLDDGKVSAVLVIPAGLSESLASSKPSPIQVLEPSDVGLGTDLARLVADQFLIRSWAEATVVAKSGDRIGAWPLEVKVESATGNRLDAATFYGPAIGMFFVLLTLGFAAQTHVADRQSGVVDRMTTMGSPPGAVLVGRSLAGGVIGGVSFATTALTMALVFDRSWGPPGPVLALIGAVLLFSIGMAAAIASIARTPAQAQLATTGIAFLLALGSGSFNPPGSTGRPWFSPIVPTSWSLDGFAELAVDGAGIGAIDRELVLLAVVGAALAGMATLVSARRA
ncbi:MAG: ABC transporter permease [Aquihabitans sp.]